MPVVYGSVAARFTSSRCGAKRFVCCFLSDAADRDFGIWHQPGDWSRFLYRHTIAIYPKRSLLLKDPLCRSRRVQRPLFPALRRHVVSGPRRCRASKSETGRCLDNFPVDRSSLLRPHVAVQRELFLVGLQLQTIEFVDEVTDHGRDDYRRKNNRTDHHCDVHRRTLPRRILMSLP